MHICMFLFPGTNICGYFFSTISKFDVSHTMFIVREKEGCYKKIPYNTELIYSVL